MREYHDVLLAVQTGNKFADDDRMSMKDRRLFYLVAGSDGRKIRAHSGRDARRSSATG